MSVLTKNQVDEVRGMADGSLGIVVSALCDSHEELRATAERMSEALGEIARSCSCLTCQQATVIATDALADYRNTR